jgi:hypothetical protein
VDLREARGFGGVVRLVRVVLDVGDLLRVDFLRVDAVLDEAGYLVRVVFLRAMGRL